MFGFLSMMENYADRKVDRYEKGKLFVSTARVTDSSKPFETAVSHPNYDGGKIVIVELYDTLKGAQAGHKKWVRTMTAKKLPKSLRDVSTADVAAFCDAVNGEKWRKKAAAK